MLRNRRTYESLDPWRNILLTPKVGVNSCTCRVVDVTKPSWFKGLGLVIAGLAIPGIAVAWKLKKGFVD